MATQKTKKKPDLGPQVRRDVRGFQRMAVAFDTAVRDARTPVEREMLLAVGNKFCAQMSDYLRAIYAMRRRDAATARRGRVSRA